VITGAIESYGITTWPMADDEVPSLVEMGLSDVPPSMFSVPPDQVGRLARTNPVWYRSQRFLIDHLPGGDVRYRVPSVVWSVLTVAVAFLATARIAGMPFAAALVGVLLGSEPFVFLAQINRFYSLPLLLLTLTFVTIWWPRDRPWMVVVTGFLAALTVLAHNMTMVVLVLAFLASLSGLVVTDVPRRVLVRSGFAAAVGLGLYVFYIRPLIAGWNSTGNPTPVLVSFVAHAGVPTLALAVFGVSRAWAWRREQPALLWWALMFAGSFCVFELAHIGWNPRYFVFFMPALWMLAACAVAAIGRAVGGGFAGAVWYACIAMLFAPGLLSHLQDGSRHDYRAAAHILIERASHGEPILSDDAETISYYLPRDRWAHLQVRTKVRVPPASAFFLVTRANVWMPQPEFPGRQMNLLAEIERRRFDQFSHVLRVYYVAPVEPQ
jgi:hypothetical protein